MLETLLSFALATTILACSPGPDNIFVLTQSIVNGRKFGLATVFGLISGCLVHTTLLAFGVSAIIKQSENLFFVIKLFGAIYLYTDVINAKDLGYQLQVQRDYLLLKGKKRYEANAIYSRKLWFAETSKNLSLLCFLAVIVIWVWFVWQMQTDVSPIVNNP